MNKSDQPTPGLRERVAELRGWRTEGNWVISPDGERGNVLDGWAYPPFDSDLNHAHAAVVALLKDDPTKQTIFGEHLDALLSQSEGWENTWPGWDMYYWAMKATPEQICEALLRTLGGEEGA